MEQSAPFETVTKLEVAERQLRVAIRLFFEYRDMIAVHALGTAALEILSQLAKSRRIKSPDDYINERVRPEKRKEFRAIIREPQNFFKHSGRDPDKTLKFRYGVTKFHLFEALVLYQLLTGRMTPEMGMFLGWFMSKHPDLFKPLDEQSSPLEREFFAKIEAPNWDDFEAVLLVIDKFLKQGKPNSIPDHPPRGR